MSLCRKFFRDRRGSALGTLPDPCGEFLHVIEYLAPLTFRHAPVRISLWPTAISGASFELGYEVRDPEGVGDRLYARAETSLVAYDFATASPRRLTESERARLRELAGEPVAFRWRRR